MNKFKSIEEENSFLHTYILSLRKERTEKDIEIGKLQSELQELKAERVFAKGEMKEIKKNVIVKKYVEESKNLRDMVIRLKKDIEKLIIENSKLKLKK